MVGMVAQAYERFAHRGTAHQGDESGRRRLDADVNVVERTKGARLHPSVELRLSERYPIRMFVGEETPHGQTLDDELPQGSHGVGRLLMIVVAHHAANHD